MKMNIVATWVVLGVFVASSFAEEAKPDREAIQGNWQIIQLEDGSGAAPPQEALAQMWFAIEQDKMTPRMGPALKQHSATFKLDAEQKPRTIDLVGFGLKEVESPDGGGPKMVPNPDPVLGIYELEGDTLRLCLSGPGAVGQRPTDFKALDGRRQTLLVLRRKSE